MWILARLIILIGGFYIRYTNIFRKRFKFDQQHSNISYSVLESKHNGKIIEYCLAVPIETDTVFKISKENETNRFLKSVGFASEIQTGDMAFDDRYYIGSDHFHFNHALRKDPAIRELIHDLIVVHLMNESIICDGRALYIKSKTTIIEYERTIEMLQKLSEKIKPIAQTSKFQAYKDPFIFKLLIFESVLFALGCYAFEAFFEYLMTDQYVMVDSFGIFAPGTITGLIIIGALIAVFFKFFRESSRSHFILIGNIVFLLIGAPFWGTKTFLDLNQSLDKSQVQSQTIHIERKEIQVHRSRKGGKSYTYHWYYSDQQGYGDNDSMKVALDVFNSVNEGDNVEIKTRKGAFNYPYRISINNIQL